MILDYISGHWLEWVFALCLTFLTFAWRQAMQKLKEEHAKNEAIGAGVQSLLRESIVQNFNNYHDKGYCPIYAKESIKKVYHAYHDLGGNDVATDLYQKLLQMPTETKERRNGDEDE